MGRFHNTVIAIDDPQRVLQQDSPGIRQLLAALERIEQADAQLILHFLNDLAECGLGDRQLGSGGGKTAVLGDLCKIFQFSNVQKRLLSKVISPGQAPPARKDRGRW